VFGLELDGLDCLRGRAVDVHQQLVCVSPEPPYLDPVKSEASERIGPLLRGRSMCLPRTWRRPGARRRDLRPHGPAEPEDAHGPAGAHHLGRRAGDRSQW